jgi:polar amino acid transport system ATP-binding protein
MSVVVVTHEMDFARAVSDRVLLILDGNIVEEGTPEAVLDNPTDPRARNFLAHADDLIDE